MRQLARSPRPWPRPKPSSSIQRSLWWPVCAVSETAAPHRMGAALTYARRYGLFTLVGIAGEDDLDVPDLIAPTTSSPHTEEPPVRKTRGRPNGGPAHSDQGLLGSRQNNRPNPTRLLGPDASAAVRDRLLTELSDISSAEQAATWGFRRSPQRILCFQPMPSALRAPSRCTCRS